MGIPPEHDFTLSREEWEQVVFDRATYFVVTRILGYGKRNQVRFSNPHDAFDNAGDEHKALVYAVTDLGRFVLLPKEQKDRFMAEWDTKHG
jgi:hypothetical protein